MEFSSIISFLIILFLGILAINFEIKKGEKVAIVGPSGSGKTTLIALLFRYYDFQEGEITIDNKKIKKYDVHSLRRELGLVPILKTFNKLGISIEEQKRLTGVAVDFVMDSVSVATTFKKQLSKLGIIFCSFSEAVQEHPELVKKYINSVVPPADNFFAALNGAVFSDGSFCYIPNPFSAMD